MTQAQPLSAHVHLGYGFGAEQYQQLYLHGLAPDRVPYGFHHAEELDTTVTYSLDHPESRTTRFTRRSLQRLFGFDVVHAWRNRAAIRNAEIVWTMEEKQYLAILFWARLLPSLRHKPVVGQTIWLFDRWKKLSRLKRFLLLGLLRRASALTVHSQNYVGSPELADASLHTQLLPFGISQDSFPLSTHVGQQHTPIRILSMGTDPTRDWDTLLTAFGNDSRFEVIAISKALTDERVAPYRNIKLETFPTMDVFRECYRWADFVVVPMSANLYSGITTALEATSMGVPVVSSATGGVPTYFSAEEVLYVAPGDPAAMKNAVLACTDDERKLLVERAQQKFVREDYSSRGMAHRYIQLSRQLVAVKARTTDRDNYRALPSHPTQQEF